MPARLVTTPGGEKIVFLGLAEYKALLEENARLRRMNELPETRANLYKGKPVSPTEGLIISALSQLDLVQRADLLQTLNTSKEALRVAITAVRKIIAPVRVYNVHGRGYYVSQKDRKKLKEGLGTL